MKAAGVHFDLASSKTRDLLAGFNLLAEFSTADSSSSSDEDGEGGGEDVSEGIGALSLSSQTADDVSNNE